MLASSSQLRKISTHFLFYFKDEKGNDQSEANIRSGCLVLVLCAKVKSHLKKHINAPWKPEAEIELVRAFMPVLVTSNFDDDSIKNELAWRHHLPIISLWESF